MDQAVISHTTHLSRRALLTKAAVAAPVAALAAVGGAALAPAAHPSAHPDAELLALGAEYDALIDVCDADYWPDGTMPPHMWARLHEIDSLVPAIEPHTFAGVAVKLRMLWLWTAEDPVEHRYGAQPGSSPDSKMLWGLIQRVGALAKGG